MERYGCAASFKDALTTGMLTTVTGGDGKPCRTFFGEYRVGRRKICLDCRREFFTGAKARKCWDCKPSPLRHCKKCGRLLIEPRFRICSRCRLSKERQCRNCGVVLTMPRIRLCDECR
jgi:hypothetical protein